MRIVVWNELKSKYWKFLGFHVAHGTQILWLRCLGGRKTAWEILSSLLSPWMQLVAQDMEEVARMRGSHRKIVPAWHKMHLLPLLATVHSPLLCFRCCIGQCKTKCVFMKAEPYVARVPWCKSLLTLPTNSFQGLKKFEQPLFFIAEHPCLL